MIINILSGIVMILLLTVLWVMVRFSYWENIMSDAEEEK